MGARCLHISSAYGIAVISIIGGILTGLATWCLHEFGVEVFIIAIAAGLATVVFLLGILLLVGVIKSSRRVVFTYLVVHAVGLSIATISQIAYFIKILVGSDLRIYDIYLAISSGIILIDWILLGIVCLYYKKVLVDSNPGYGYNKCVEELLTEKTTEK